MKSIHGNKLALSTALGLLGAALGCSGGGTQDNSSGSGTGGADGGNHCTWDGTGGGITLPDCSAYRNSINLVGTIDGKPFDSLWTNNPTAVDPIDSQITQTLDVILPAKGHLHLEWPRPTVWGQWIDVTGTLLLPLETTPRAVKPVSKVRLKCGAGLYQYILTVDGGELNGCSIN